MSSRSALALVSTCSAAFGLAGCGGSASTGTTQSSAPTQSTEPVQAAEPVRLGCHQYCQQAGGYGAGPDEKPPLATVATRGTVTPAGGVVPIEVSASFERPARGRSS